MRLDGDRRTGRLLGRLPRLTAYSWAELILLVLIAVQCARLFWILVAPVGPVGDWRATSAAAAPADASVLASFDPFFRLDGTSGPTVVTSLTWIASPSRVAPPPRTARYSTPVAWFTTSAHSRPSPSSAAIDVA